MKLLVALLEWLMIACIAVGLGLWIAPGAGLAAYGALGLAMLVVAQLPPKASS